LEQGEIQVSSGQHRFRGLEQKTDETQVSERTRWMAYTDEL